MVDTDALIMARLRDGEDEEEATAALVERYQHELVGYFYHQCWNQTLAEELAQTVFIKVYHARRRWKATAKVRTYLYRIAHNAWIDHLRRSKHHISLDAEMGRSGMRLVDALADETAPQRLDAEESQTIRERVREAVEKLPEGQRAVFVLANNQEMKYQEISEVLEIPVGTIKSRMHAAVRTLRRLLSDLVEA